MSIAVVDTDVVSYLFKNHSNASLYLPDVADKAIVISLMTVAELDRWALEGKWSESRRKRLLEYLSPFTILPYRRELCAKWAEVTVSAKAVGG